MRHDNAPGPADTSFNFGPAGAGWMSLSGDWNGDGRTTVGLYNPTTSTFFLKNSNTPGPADIVYQFGPAGAGWQPVVGDWDGNGTQTVGLYSGSAFFLQNNHQGGAAALVFSYGPASAGWKPMAGDWNASGADSIGLYSGGSFFLKNSNAAGAADVVFNFGPADANWTPMAGDWNNNGTSTVGLYSGSAFFLRNVNAAGVADVTINYGPANAGWRPLDGNWTTLSTSPVLFAAAVNNVQQITINGTGCIVDNTFMADLSLSLIGNGMSGSPFSGSLLVDGSNQAVHAAGSSGECDLSVANQTFTLDRPVESMGQLVVATDGSLFYTATFVGEVSADMSQVVGTLNIIAPLANINLSIPVTLVRQAG